MDIRYFDKKVWAKRSAELLQKSIDEFKLEKKVPINVMLTGGNSAELVYGEWAKLKNFQQSSDLNFYLTDERCVPDFHEHSNSNMIRKTLFQDCNLRHLAKFYTIDAGNKNLLIASDEYEKILPHSIDFLILSVGKDGHVASLFPNGLLEHGDRKIIATSSVEHPYKRISITARVIRKAKKIFVLANGEEKFKILKRVMLLESGESYLPAIIAKDGEWLIDVDSSLDLK